MNKLIPIAAIGAAAYFIWKGVSANTLQSVEMYRWYYEPFAANVGINSINGNEKPVVSMFPNPVTNELTLRFADKAPKGVIRLRITNSMGRLVQSETLLRQGMDAKVAAIENLASGVYCLSVYDANNAVLFEGSFVRQ